MDSTNPRGHVLVVDDARSNRELVRQDLEEAGFQVATAEGGAAGLEIARTSSPALEVAILDMHMPGMDGIEMCRRLKADPVTAGISVLFLTGRSNDEITVAALAAGGNDFIQKPYSPVVLLARVSCQLEIFRAHQRLRELAMTDELTGLFSRRYLFEALRQQIKLSMRATTGELSCLMIDVDHFKSINDEAGHDEGDRVLRSISSTIREATRGSDTVARFGGEEFAVILPGTSGSGAALVAEKIRAAVEDQFREKRPVTISVGVATRRIEKVVLRELGEEEILRTLLKQADTTLYEAKAQGRNRICMSASVGD